MSRNTKTYSIICSTDYYHASRDSRFARNENIYVVASNLTIKEAQKQLLEMFSEDAGRLVDNWGLAVSNHYRDGLEAYKSHNDGTRAYEFDIYTYSIIEQSNC